MRSYSRLAASFLVTAPKLAARIWRFVAVRGSRAAYRVHLTSGSIHLEPGGYPCIVAASFGGTPRRRRFLPFADEDRMTSVILSKVLPLNDDEHITGPVILAQLPPSA
jgi:hypothetical protein